MLNSELFLAKLQQIQFGFADKKFLLALSGGADSMVLADLMLKSGVSFEVAHVNYRLRGEDSHKDQELVEKFCTENAVKFHGFVVDDDTSKRERSIQLWARELRYNFFSKILKYGDLDFLVTAHHLNDNIETFLMHLARGSGLKGLSGIPENENKILRPLLYFSKDEIYAYAKQNRIEFREDASNRKNDYLRNKIRNRVVPKIEENIPNFNRGFQNSIEHLAQAKDFISEKIDEIFEEISTRDGNIVIINKEELKEQSPFVKFEILRKFGFTHAAEIEKMFHAKTGATFTSKSFQINIDAEHMILNKIDVKEHNDIVEIELEGSSSGMVVLPHHLFDQNGKSEPFCWSFDQEKIFFPLKLRHPKTDDLFFPIGMIGRKKVSKFLRDEKIPTLARPKIWVLVDAKDSILGVLPYRQDGRFATRSDTKKSITICLIEGVV